MLQCWTGFLDTTAFLDAAALTAQEHTFRPNVINKISSLSKITPFLLNNQAERRARSLAARPSMPNLAHFGSIPEDGAKSHPD